MPSSIMTGRARVRPAFRTRSRSRALLLVMATLPAPAVALGGAHSLMPGGLAGLRGTVGPHTPGYLGITFRDTTEDQAAATIRQHGGRGAEVVMVDHDGPAGQAGLHPHDIVLALNGQILTGADALRRMIHEAGAGAQVAIEVLRGGKLLTLNARLADQEAVVRAAWAKLAAAGPPPGNFSSVGPNRFVAPGASATDSDTDAVPAPSPSPARGFIGNVLHGGSWTGLTLQAMEPQLADFFGAPRGMGLLVQSVEPNSPAALAGIHAGDVVLRADLFALRSPSDLGKRLHAAKGKPVSLSILRDKHEETLLLPPELKHHSRVEWPF